MKVFKNQLEWNIDACNEKFTIRIDIVLYNKKSDVVKKFVFHIDSFQ